MRKCLYLFLFFALLTASGGCGGGGDGENRNVASGALDLVAGGLAGQNVDAWGYFEAEVVMDSDADRETHDLMLLLLGTPEGGGREEILGSVAVKHLRKGENKYRFRMYGAACDHEMNDLKTGSYAKTRLALIPGEASSVEVGNDSVDLEATVSYTAAGELPVIVRDSMQIDVKEPPASLGFAEANRLARDDRGWWRMEAGRVNGEPVVVAYTATVDLRLELSCASWDVEAFEITENGGALLLGNHGGDPAGTLLWKGPFQSGEAGITFTVMYWGNATPPDISTLSFTVRPVRDSGSTMDEGKFTTLRAADETLRASRRVRTADVSAERITYRSFASIVWHLWKAYELEPKAAGRAGEWDTAPAPAFWYAKLMKDLSKVVDWNTAIAEYSGLAGVKMKSDYFSGDRPINFEDSGYNVNQFIRIPKVYYDAEQKYNSLYASSGSPFPFGDTAYLSWWCTLPTWMLRELIFPIPTRSYGTLTLGDAKNDDYLWQVAFPMFVAVASAYGTQSYEYAIFWNDELGTVQADNPVQPSRTPEAYRALFPQAEAAPSELLPGGDPGSLPELNDKKPITFDYGASFIRYRNELSSSKSLGNGSTKLNAGYELSYSDGVQFDVDRNEGYDPTQNILGAHNWTSLQLDVPVWIFDRRFSVLNAGTTFDSVISADVTASSDLAALRWESDLLDERTSLQTSLKLLGITLFDKNIRFELSTEEKANLKDHPKEVYPLISKAFEKPLISPDMAAVVLGPVKLAFGIGVTGEAGIDFNYRYGKQAQLTDTQYLKNSHVVGVRMELEPYVEAGGYAQVTVGLPLTPPAPPVGLALRGDLNVVRLGLPLYYEREMGFAAERMEMTPDGPLPRDTGDLYYSLRNRGEYGMDLGLGGLDGELKLTVEALVIEKEFSLYEWDGIKYIDDVNLFKAGQFLPLALPVIGGP